MIGLLVALLAAVQDPSVPEKPIPLPEWKSPAQERPAPFPSELDAPGEGGLLIQPRVGGWWTGRFEATTPLGKRIVRRDLLLDNGLDAGIDLGSWGVLLTVDYGASHDLTIITGGLLVEAAFALAEEDPLPLEVRLAAGVLAGRMEVDAQGFGDFDPGVGFEARLSLAGWIQRDLALTLWIDYRQIEFEYAEPVTSGDTDFPGSSVAVGGAISLRF